MKGLLRVALLGYGRKKEMGPSRSEAYQNLRAGNNFHNSGIASLIRLL